MCVYNVGMRKIIFFASILVIIIIVIIVLLRIKCTPTSMDPVIPEETADSSDEFPGLVYEDSFPPDTSPGMIDPLDFAHDLLKSNPDITETELRVEMYKAGFFAYEIKATVEKVMPKEESSKPAESSESSSESSKTEESSKQEESSKNEESKQNEDQNNESEESKSGSDTNESSKQEESSKQQESSKTESSSQQQQESSKPQESSKTEESSKQEKSKPESSTQQQQQESQTSTCDHEWVDVTEVVHHDAVTEEVWVVDEAAWDETVNKTETQEVAKCKCRCGMLFDSSADWDEHALSYLDDVDELDNHSGWTRVYVTEEVVVGTETIHHDEVGHYETRTVTEAYDETVVTGQKCSKCGATK